LESIIIEVFGFCSDHTFPPILILSL